VSAAELGPHIIAAEKKHAAVKAKKRLLSIIFPPLISARE
jgi:hypothetical protein